MLDWKYEGFAVASSQKFHRGVVGLIATKLSGELNLPSFVGSIDEDGVITGSARMPQGRNDSLLTAMSAATQYLRRFGGHDMAAGFELHQDQLPGFINKLDEHFKTVDNNAAKVFSYDAELPISDLNESLMGWFETLGPFGAGFEMPVFCIRNISVVSANVLKAKHLKIKVMSEADKKTFEMLYFSAPKEVIENPPQFGDLIDVIGEIQWNYFSGRKSIQLLLKDFRFKN
jgi:single-stranded-DNA-specific exonuclease